MDHDWLFSVLDDLETLAWEHRLDETALQIWRTRRIAERNILALSAGDGGCSVPVAAARAGAMLH